jgi:hypothetical protein
MLHLLVSSSQIQTTLELTNSTATGQVGRRQEDRFPQLEYSRSHESNHARAYTTQLQGLSLLICMAVCIHICAHALQKSSSGCNLIYVNPFPCGVGPFGPGSSCFNTTQRGSILKIWKNYVIHGSCLSLIFIFRCFIKKCYFIPVIHGFLGPTPKSWAIWPTAALWAILHQCGKNSLKKIRSRPVASLY